MSLAHYPPSGDRSAAHYTRSLYYSNVSVQHANRSVLFEPLPWQPHDECLQLLGCERHTPAPRQASTDEAA
ncbi:MAG: hypothetical protein WAU49_12590, partial [Steroidobacteraceae bacterium]